jgi:hypothetical protein
MQHVHSKSRSHISSSIQLAAVLAGMILVAAVGIGALVVGNGMF